MSVLRPGFGMNSYLPIARRGFAFWKINTLNFFLWLIFFVPTPPACIDVVNGVEELYQYDPRNRLQGLLKEEKKECWLNIF